MILKQYCIAKTQEEALEMISNQRQPICLSTNKSYVEQWLRDSPSAEAYFMFTIITIVERVK